MNLESLMKADERLDEIIDNTESGTLINKEALNWQKDISVVIDFIQNYTYLCDFLDENEV